MRSKRRFNLRDVFLFFVGISILCLFFASSQLTWFMTGFTAIIGFIYLITVWDEIVAWWSTR